MQEQGREPRKLARVRERLQERLREGGFQLAVFTLPWFICLFINTLPFITVMRVWDVIMFEGDKALIRIALALLSIGERDLLKCHDFSEFSTAFKCVRV